MKASEKTNEWVRAEVEHNQRVIHVECALHVPCTFLRNAAILHVHCLDPQVVPTSKYSYSFTSGKLAIEILLPNTSPF